MSMIWMGARVRASSSFERVLQGERDEADSLQGHGALRVVTRVASQRHRALQTALQRSI
ncbi:hypothetical protein PRIPAC_84655, partial [Pristionchus pacificus]|uniref:Uncharacterized protein n=1 Tax=Pristionchus pacificus TaxID=54126 RepID=A0A2A6BLS3_PRIPA